MPKMKSHRGAAKRFKRTGSGKFLLNRANRRHLLEKKSANRKRRLRGSGVVDKTDHERVKRMLPYA